jgi:hypothetical protein
MKRRQNYHNGAKEAPCMDCKKVYPRTEEFFYTTPIKNGFALDLTCKKCRIASHILYKDRSREYKDKYNIYQASRSKSNKARKLRIKIDLKRKNLKPEQYDELLTKQNNRCAGCGRFAASFKRRLAVDHDHSCCPTTRKSCGKCIRGLLCNDCNVALDHLRDSVSTLKSLIAYLEFYHENKL